MGQCSSKNSQDGAAPPKVNPELEKTHSRNSNTSTKTAPSATNDKLHSAEGQGGQAQRQEMPKYNSAGSEQMMLPSMAEEKPKHRIKTKAKPPPTIENKTEGDAKPQENIVEEPEAAAAAKMAAEKKAKDEDDDDDWLSPYERERKALAKKSKAAAAEERSGFYY